MDESVWDAQDKEDINMAEIWDEEMAVLLTQTAKNGYFKVAPGRR